jgi:hypothetical protein
MINGPSFRNPPSSATSGSAPIMHGAAHARYGTPRNLAMVCAGTMRTTPINFFNTTNGAHEPLRCCFFCTFADAHKPRAPCA